MAHERVREIKRRRHRRAKRLRQRAKEAANNPQAQKKA